MTLTRSAVGVAVDRGSLRTRARGESVGVPNFTSLRPRPDACDVTDIGVLGLYHIKHVSQSKVNMSKM